MSPSRSRDADDGLVLSKVELARLLDVSLPTVEKWLHRGLPAIERGRRGRPWRIDAGAAIEWLMDERERRIREEHAAQTGPLDLDHQRARESKERADRLALENVETRRSVIPRRDVVEVWDALQSAAAAMVERLLERISQELPDLDEGQIDGIRGLFEVGLAELDAGGVPESPDEVEANQIAASG